MKYRKTVLIEAEQFDGSVEMADKYDIRKYLTIFGEKFWRIWTLEGFMTVNNGDWIATGINGEHWAIADDIFKRTYEPVTETKAQQECPYCHDGKIIVGDDDLKVNVMVHLGCLFIVPKLIKPMGFAGAGGGINYCPMCGKKLR